MIRAKYVHEFDPFDEVSKAIMESESYADQLINEYNLKCEEIQITNLSESVDDPYFSEGAKEVVEGIGKAVETVINKVIELIDKVVSTFNQFIWNRKSDIEKMNALFKRYPEYKTEIKLALDSGDLNIKDIKSIQDVMNGSYDLLDKLNKGKINPSEAESKFQSLVNKFNKYGKPIIEIAAGVTTVITAAKAISSLYPTLMKNKIDKQETKRTLEMMKRAARMQNREDRRTDGKLENPATARVKNKIINGCCSIVNTQLKGQNKIFGKFGHWVSSTLKRFESTDYNDSMRMNVLDRDRRRDNSIKMRNSIDEYRAKEKAKKEKDTPSIKINPRLVK